ncbi:sodium-coupled monocarboxylate transporter 1-like [Oratosquilla oratoria]|uniref:sodium-coupled monocarboxylate transporter 1-like n=1 Tax=Oratosquilla oratoria TaxID=337810 RepID=UPI003F75963F
MGLGTLDIVLFSISLLLSAAIGIYHSIKGARATPDEYMLGNKNLSPLPLAMSLTVGSISALTILGNAGEVYAYGTQIWVMDIGLVAGIIVVAKFFVPIFYSMDVLSMFQYVEKRFSSKALRKATVIISLVGQYIYLGFLLVPATLVLENFTNLPVSANIVLIGATCTIYSAFGGVKAVVYADVFQALVMVAGVVAIIAQGAASVGGLGQVWDIGFHHNRTEFLNLSLDPYQRHSVWLVIVLGFFFGIYSFGVNQGQMQRAFSTGSVEKAQRVFYYGAAGMVLFRGLSNLAGLVIFSNYAGCDPLTMAGITKHPGLIVPIYVTYKLTEIPGLAGLFVAAIYSAVLSSNSTSLNSMVALIWADFLSEIKYFQEWSQVKVGYLQKCLVLVLGVLGILASFAAAHFHSLMEGVFALVGVFSGPMVSLFLLAVFFPWVRTKGAVAGFVASLIFSSWICVSTILKAAEHPFLPLSIDQCPHLAVAKRSTPEPIIANATLVPEVTEEDLLTTTLAPEVFEEDASSEYKGLYTLSYCLNAFTSIFIGILVALAVTGCTGSNEKDEVDPSLVDPKAWNIFQSRAHFRRPKFFLSFLGRKEKTPLPTATTTTTTSNGGPNDKSPTPREEDDSEETTFKV